MAQHSCFFGSRKSSAKLEYQSSIQPLRRAIVLQGLVVVNKFSDFRLILPHSKFCPFGNPFLDNDRVLDQGDGTGLVVVTFPGSGPPSESVEPFL